VKSVTRVTAYCDEILIRSSSVFNEPPDSGRLVGQQEVGQERGSRRSNCGSTPHPLPGGLLQVAVSKPRRSSLPARHTSVDACFRYSTRTSGQL